MEFFFGLGGLLELISLHPFKIKIDRPRPKYLFIVKGNIITHNNMMIIYIWWNHTTIIFPIFKKEVKIHLKKF